MIVENPKNNKKQYLVVLQITVFFACLAIIKTYSNAQTCETRTGFGSYVNCFDAGCPGSWSAYPQQAGNPVMCPDDTSVCCVENAHRCDSAPQDRSCKATACPGGNDYELPEYACVEGSRCCDNLPPSNCLPSTLPYLSCATATHGCDSPSQTYSSSYRCDPGYECCVNNCVHPNYCATTPVTPSDLVTTAYYCASGQKCYTSSGSQHTCESVNGTCRDGNSCTVGQKDEAAYGCPSNQPTCCVGEFSTNCPGGQSQCVDKYADCPTGTTSDYNFACDPTGQRKCCVSMAPCDPTSTAGSLCTPENGHMNCFTCGSGGCNMHQKCTWMGSDYRCIGPCNLAGPLCDLQTGIVGRCGSEGGCSSPDQLCVDASPNPVCVQTNMCGLFVQSPYTGPIISIAQFIARIFAAIYPGAALLGILFIGRAGYTLMTSEGNPTKVQEGKDQMTSALVGTATILGGFPLLRILIKTFFGITF
jgi:hypothetical protein